MTEKLKTLMTAQADSVDFAMPDLDTMVRDGDRRRRTRRVGAVAGIAAAVAGVALVATLVPTGEQVVAPAAPTSASPALSWVEGTTLHEGDQVFDLDFRPRAYVRTSEGYVLADRDGGVWSWVAGVSTRVGETTGRSPHLVSDEESGLAAWVTLEGPQYVVLDQVSGEVTGLDAPEDVEYDDVVALDAGTAYWQGRETGLVGVDLETGRATTVPVDGTVADVEDDLVAVRTDAGISVRTLAGKELRVLEGFHGELGAFSDDARYFTNDADVPQVYDVAAGEQVEIPVGTREFASGYEWLDDRTLALIASAEASDDSRVQLVRCTVPDGDCETVTTLMTFDEAVERLVVPVGVPIDG